jgi:hypothetical protein
MLVQRREWEAGTDPAMATLAASTGATSTRAIRSC